MYKVPNQMTQEGTYLDDFAPEIPGEGREEHLAFSISSHPAPDGNGGKALLGPH